MTQSDFQQPEMTPPTEKTIPATETIGEQTLISCPNCGTDAILLSKTIQTYCYHCGERLTRLGSTGLYYEPIPVTEAEPE